VRTAIQQRLQQKLKGKHRGAAFAAIEKVVEEIMYMPAKENVEATQQAAEQILTDFRTKCALPTSQVLHSRKSL
jgi:hypothetical protein